MIKDKEVKFVDLRFTDTKGKWQHTAQTSSTIDENTLKMELCLMDPHSRLERH